MLLVLVLVGVTLVTISDRNGNSGIFARARTYARDVADPFQSGVHSLSTTGDGMISSETAGRSVDGSINYDQLTFNGT